MSLNQASLPFLPPFSGLTNRIAIFLLRRNLMGALGEKRMVLTTRHPVTGQTYSTTIPYARDGNGLIAASRKGTERWYRYAMAHPNVRLVVRGRPIHAYARPIRDPNERQQALQVYCQELPEMGGWLCDGVKDAPVDERREAFQKVELLRFVLLSW